MTCRWFKIEQDESLTEAAVEELHTDERLNRHCEAMWSGQRWDTCVGWGKGHRSDSQLCVEPWVGSVAITYPSL